MTFEEEENTSPVLVSVS